MRKAWKRYLAVLASTAIIFTGCGISQNNQTDTETNTTEATTESSSNTYDAVALSTTSQVVVDTEFTANDLEVGYEDTASTKVVLNGSSIEVTGDGASAKDGVLTISDEGTYVLEGTLTDGQIIVEADDSDKVQIVLNGVNITCSDSAPVYIKNADKVFITLGDNTENTLTDGSEYVQTDDNTVDGVIFSTADLTLNGDGTLTITGKYKHGIASKDDLIITGGTYNITAVKDALNGKDCVKISNGTLNLSVTDGNGIQSKNGDDTTKGYVYICGGEINILNCQEGIEGTAIVISDGTINITAQDDGLNAASGDASTTDDSSTGTDGTASSDTDTAANLTTMSTTSTTSTTTPDATGFTRGDKGDFGGGGGAMQNDSNCYISIAGGSVTIDASGDGIDSNGSINISGGTTYVSGPTNDGNAGMDYNGTAEITGGTVVVAGSSGMAQGFSDTSSQYSLLYNLTNASAADTEVRLADSDGNVVVSYTPNKQYQSVVISSPDLVKDATYTLTSGDQTADITLSTVVTSNGQQGFGGFGSMPGRGGMPGQPGQKGMGRPGDDFDNSTDTSEN